MATRGNVGLNSGLSQVSFCFLVCFTRNRTFAVFLFQGTNASALEKDIGPEQFPINEHYFGLVNVSILKCTVLIRCFSILEAMSLPFSSLPSFK